MVRMTEQNLSQPISTLHIYSNRIDELKAKVAELTATIEAMEAEEAKLKKFEWKYTYGDTFFLNEHSTTSGSCGDDKDFIEHGRYRLTKKAAKQSLARNKRANRLEALAEQLGGLKEFAEDEYNYYIYCRHNTWYKDSNSCKYSPEKVYMTKECATEICRMLNEGEFSLDGEL